MPLFKNKGDVATGVIQKSESIDHRRELWSSQTAKIVKMLRLIARTGAEGPPLARAIIAARVTA